MGEGHFQKGAVLGVAAAALGLLTTLSGIVIELGSDLLADLRHGVCVERFPGDTRPLWHATLDGGWRPYDRMRCCGGSGSVDHTTEECRAQSIIQHSRRKRIAHPVTVFGSFGLALPAPRLPLALMVTAEYADGEKDNSGSARATATEKDVHASNANLRSRGHAARAAHVREVVGVDAARVRAHMSHVWAPDPAERWAEEAAGSGEPHFTSLTEEATEIAANEGVVQTQSESAGSLAPTYEWVPWERAVLARRGRSLAFFIYVAGSALFALLAALVTRGRPAAKGSGIPEVKAAVAGFAIPKSFQAGTLAAKVLALSLCVGAGLAVGKEGPMIHIGACWGVLLAAWLRHLGVAIEETEIICVGAAAGVSAAFGAPLAGVLFAIEELGTTMPTGLRYTTMICSFGSAVVAAMALKWVDLTRTQRLTLFEVDYKQAWAPWEALPFCMLGVCGGVLGAGFVLANEAIHKRRLSAESNGSASWFLGTNVSRILHRRLGLAIDGRVLEVVLLGILTAVSNYPNTLTRMLQNDAIKALFSQCPDTAASRHRMPLQDPVGLCGDPQDAVALWELLRLLLGAASLRFLQATVTFGALTPAGLFVPSLYMGGCFGRAVGVLMKSAGFPGTQGIEPGIYAMVGAGAMLAGVSRLTLSLAVVLFELTGGLTYVVPFMLAVLTAKWTGDALTNDRSVYDVHGELKGFTKVEQPNEVRLLNATLRDIRTSTASTGLGIQAFGDGNSRSLAASSAAPPAPLWVSAGRVWSSDLAAHCRAAGSAAGSAAGFPVLSIGSRGTKTREADLELLGWAHADRVLAQLALAGVAADKANFWCQFTPVQRSARAGEPRVEDFSQAIEPRAVVRVRGDCPLQTAFCIFQNCPDVRALVSVDGAPFSVQTTTRELFASSLLHSSLCALSSEGTPLCAAEKASNACLAANSHRLDLRASAPGFEKGSTEGAGSKSEQH